MGFLAGLRIIVEPHGGHFWSTQGQIHRPLDVTSLRIDHAERMTLQLADGMISPTRYMRAFLLQRGWKLPREQYDPPLCLPQFSWHSPPPPMLAFFFSFSWGGGCLLNVFYLSDFLFKDFCWNSLHFPSSRLLTLAFFPSLLSAFPSGPFHSVSFLCFP